MWCLGNEMDGPWQIGHKTADEYGRLAAETARAMRMVDPDLELVACGSSRLGDADLRRLGGDGARARPTTQVDYISCHAYYEEKDGDLGSFLASAVDMDHFIESVVATADARARGKRAATSGSTSRSTSGTSGTIERHRVDKIEGDNWPVAPRLLEDHYNVADAVVVGNLLISLLRHADRVTAACLAQLVNVIAPIMTEPGGAWRQTTFHPFALTSRYAGECCGSSSTRRPTRPHGSARRRWWTPWRSHARPGHGQQRREQIGDVDGDDRLGSAVPPRGAGHQRLKAASTERVTRAAGARPSLGQGLRARRERSRPERSPAAAATL